MRRTLCNALRLQRPCCDAPSLALLRSRSTRGRVTSATNHNRNRLDLQWQSQARFNSSRASMRDDEDEDNEQTGTYSEADHEHAVISTFDLFSIGIGPSSSHTVGPMRAGNIFISDLEQANLLSKVAKIHISLYGSLALTGEGHMTPSALLLGLESAQVETVDTAYVPARFETIKTDGKLYLGKGLPSGKGQHISFDYDRDFRWQWGKKLPLHSNGMRLTVFDEGGNMLATNDFFSVGGGFVVNGALSTASGSDTLHLQDSQAGSGGHPVDLAENVFYKEIRREDAASDRRAGAVVKPMDDSAEHIPQLDQPTENAEYQGEKSLANVTEPSPKSFDSKQPLFAFSDAKSLLALCNKHNLTIAQLVYENEKSQGYTDDEIHEKLLRIWEVMDNSILEGVQADANAKLPGSLQLHRRAPALYRGLSRGLYPAKTLPTHEDIARPVEKKTDPGEPGLVDNSAALAKKTKGVAKRNSTATIPRIHGNLYHPLVPSPLRRPAFPAMDYLSVYAMAVNETNAAGGRVVTAPTNGAAGIIPAVLKYTVEFVSDGYQVERDILTFLLTAAAIGMLYKRGATISAAEGGCMAEVGVACSMAAGAFAACMGARPETVAQAAEIGIEHNLGLTCDPIGGLVQAPCIERNALGAVKAISSANLALSSDPKAQKVSLDDAIRAMRVTAQGMRNEFKETSLSGLATSVPVHIPVSVPDC